MSTRVLITSIVGLFTIKPSQSQSQSLTCNTELDFNRICGPCLDISNKECNLNCQTFPDICVESILTCQIGIPCNIMCNSNYACMDSIVDATLASKLTMNCGAGTVGAPTVCEGSQVVAGTGTDIVLNCRGQENSCKDLILNAATAGNVIVNCDGWNACTGMTVNSQNAGDVTINCNNMEGGVCQAVRLNCGTGDCMINCMGANFGAANKCNGIQVTYTAVTRSFNCIGNAEECLSAPISFGPPTIAPSANPTKNPSVSPTMRPTTNPTRITKSPSSIPTISPTDLPTTSPITKRPTTNPTPRPSDNPSTSPTYNPTTTPTNPSFAPTRDPTVKGQTRSPTANPTKPPTTKSPTTATPTTPAPNTPQPSTPQPTTIKPTTRPTTKSPTDEVAIPTIPTLPSLTLDPTIAPTQEPSINPTSGAPTTAYPTSDQDDTEICCECASASLNIKGCARDPGCTKTICELDPYCCDNQWDNTCAYYASDQCSKTQQIAPQTTAQRQEPPSDLDLVWKFALVVFAVMVFIVSCCIIILRIHRMCQNCKQKKLLQQKSVSAKKVKKRGDKNSKLMRRGDSIKKLRSPANGHMIVAVPNNSSSRSRYPSQQQGVTPANSIYSTVVAVAKKNSNSHDRLDDESMTMTHEDEEQRDIVHPTNIESVTRQQSHKQYIKRQYSSNHGLISGEYSHGNGMPIAGVQSVGSSHYGMSTNNSYNSYNSTNMNMANMNLYQQRGMNVINNMAHFVAPRSLPAHNKLASNSVPPRHVVMGNGGHIDLEYGTDRMTDPSRSGMQDRYITTDMIDNHDPDEDSLSMSDDTNFNIHSPNAFTSRSRKRTKSKSSNKKRKKSNKDSIDSINNNGNIHHVVVRGQESGSSKSKGGKIKNKMQKMKKRESTETSVEDESEVPSVDDMVANELKQEMMDLKATGGKNKNKSKKKKQRQRGQSAIRQVEVKGQVQSGPRGNNGQEDSNNSQVTNSDDTDEEVTVSDDPISEIMDNLKRMQSVKHHSI